MVFLPFGPSEQDPTPEERWLDIPGYPLYEVSDQGRVARKGVKYGRPQSQLQRYVLLPEEIRSRGNSGTTYLRVGLYNGGRATRKKVFVHVLVALAFHGEPDPPDAKVDHLDSDTHNNSAGNLEWVTQSENVKRSWRRTRKRKGDG